MRQRRTLTHLFSLLLLLIGAMLPALAQSTTQTVYDDALENGWQNWSWATVNFSNTSPVHSGTDSIAVTVGGYQALYLHHAAQSLPSGTSLTFWINGGATGGQHLQVQATLSGTAQAAYAIGPVAAGQWQQVTIPLTTLGVAGNSSFDGFWIQDTTGGTQPTFYLDDMALVGSAPQNATVTVNAAAPVATLPALGVGVNTSVWDGGMLDSDIPGLLSQAGVTAMRFPGGSTSDVYHWQTNSATAGTGQYINPNDTFDAFMSVTESAHVSPIITVNYGSNAAGTAGGDPNEAAAWVNYANNVKHYGVKYWEIGNEVYGNGEYGSAWEEDLHTDHSPTAYGQNVVAYAQAMKAQDPTIKVGAVLATPGAWPDGQSPDWNTNVLAQCGTSIDFVIVHWYAQGPGGESDAGLLGSTSSIAGIVAKTRALINQYCGTNAPNVQIFVTETNSVSSGPGKQTVSLVNGLFAADDVMQWLENGVSNVDWWDLHNGATTGTNDSSSLYGTATYGDYGLFSSGGSLEPAADTPFPAYYGLQMLSALGGPGDSLVSANSSQPLLAAYAAKQSNGDLAVLLINKDPSNSDPVSVNISGYSPASTATSYFYGENSSAITSSSITGGSRFVVTTPPYSLTTVVLAPTPTPPTITTAASASPATVTGTSTTVSAQASDPQGQALTYTWSATGPAAVTFSPNGTAAASNATATFTQHGTYTLTLTATDTAGLSATSTVTVTVTSTATTLTLTPATASVPTGTTQQFTAAVTDQFGAALTAAPTWKLSGGGTLSSSGLFTAGSSAGGPFTVTATQGSAQGTASVTVTSVSTSTGPPVNAATFVSQSVPSSMVAGQTYSVSVTYQNSGTTTWTSGGNYHLGSQDPQDNSLWLGTNRVYLPTGTSVAPGQSVTFTFTVTAPAQSGSYPFQWRMVQDGVQWFGDYTPLTNVSVTGGSAPAPTPGNSATFVSQSVPSSMVAGQTYSVSVTYQNSGTTTWTSGGNYHLGSQDPQDNSLWLGTNRVYLPTGTSVAPGQSVTFTFTVTAPAQSGSYPFQWRMVQDGVQWFGDDTSLVNVSVTGGSAPAPTPGNSATFVSASVPSSMVAGQTYSVSVTYQNSGTTTWTSGGNYHLGSQDPQDNSLWLGTNRVYLPTGTSVAPGQSVTFTFTVTAPAQSGSYPFQWRMVQDGVQWFGDYTPLTNVSVG